MKHSIGIVGSGIGGMLVAWAAKQNGFDSTIYAPSPKNTPPHPAVLFHSDDCDLEGLRKCSVNYYTCGFDPKTEDQQDKYNMKVYGRLLPHVKLRFRETFYNSVDAYDQLIEKTSDSTTYKSSAIRFDDLDQLIAKHGLVFCTAPADLMFADRISATFEFATAYITAQQLPGNLDRGWCIYNCDENTDWHRQWGVFDYIMFETIKNPSPEAVKVRKVATSDFDPRATEKSFPGLILAGRYAEWDKEILSHHVYRRALTILSAFAMGREYGR